MAEGKDGGTMTWAEFRRSACFPPALIWGAAAALVVPVLLRGSFPSGVVFVLAVGAFAGVLHRARKGCVRGTLGEVVAAPVSAPLSAAVERVIQTVEKAVAVSVPAAVASAAPAPAPAAPAAPAAMARPAALPAAHGGAPDDLKRLKGVGPKLEALLHSLGVYHFDQIAAWTPNEVAWMDEHLEGFRGRVTRDDWVGQARILAAGGVTAFAARVDAGDVPSSQA
jgi:predicted flap endonuclease-1-like 5' DNA nuclease